MELNSTEPLPYLKNLEVETGWPMLAENASRFKLKEKLSSSRLPTTAHLAILPATALLISTSLLQVSITQVTVFLTNATVSSLTIMPCMSHKLALTGQTRAATAMLSPIQPSEKDAKTSFLLDGTTLPSTMKRSAAHQSLPCHHHVCLKATKSGGVATTENALLQVHMSLCFCSCKHLENELNIIKIVNITHIIKVHNKFTFHLFIYLFIFYK